MSAVRAAIEVPAGARAVYELLTRFEELPGLLEGVEEVRRVGAGRLRWSARRGDSVVRWETDVVENIVDARVAWVPAAGTRGESVAVTIDAEGDDRCLVTLAVSGLPDEDEAEVRRRVEADLVRLRDRLARNPEERRAPSPPPSDRPDGRSPDVGDALGAVPEDDGSG